VTAAATLRPAATVVLLRPSADPALGRLEVLLTLRPASMAFGPGLHVFPGGALDPGDSEPRLVARSRAGTPARIAALRELFEEAGVLLADRSDGLPAGSDPGLAAELPGLRAALVAGSLDLAAILERFELVLATDRLVYIARWQTPPGLARRFDTSFFAVELPPGAVLDLDPREVADHAWMTPGVALAAMAAGEIELWPPTSGTLQLLEHVPDITAIRRDLALPEPG
jgi:8-oxo-dGTP pyrophosphatase MutT (NUDIX family)